MSIFILNTDVLDLNRLSVTLFFSYINWHENKQLKVLK